MQAQARRVVTKIDANPILAKQNDENSLLRVAAYCRVSTDTGHLFSDFNNNESCISKFEMQLELVSKIH